MMKYEYERGFSPRQLVCNWNQNLVDDVIPNPGETFAAYCARTGASPNSRPDVKMTSVWGRSGDGKDVWDWRLLPEPGQINVGPLFLGGKQIERRCDRENKIPAVPHPGETFADYCARTGTPESSQPGVPVTSVWVDGDASRQGGWARAASSSDLFEALALERYKALRGGFREDEVPLPSFEESLDIAKWAQTSATSSPWCGVCDTGGCPKCLVLRGRISIPTGSEYERWKLMATRGLEAREVVDASVGRTPMQGERAAHGASDGKSCVTVHKVEISVSTNQNPGQIAREICAVLVHERVHAYDGSGYPDRSAVDALLREDACLCPEFAAARMAGVLAGLETRRFWDDPLGEARGTLVELHAYEGARGGGRVPRAQALRALPFHLEKNQAAIQAYEAARSHC